MRVIRAVGALGAIALGGCTAAQVYSDPDLTRIESVPVYPARPILLPSTIGPDGHPLAAAIAYVPDRSHPLYVRQFDGAGTGGFTLTCENGILTSFEQKSVGPTPGDVVTKLGGAAVTVLGAREILRETDVLKGK